MSLRLSKAETASDAYHTLIAARQAAYSEALAAGTYRPFVYPWDTIAAALLFLAILIVPRITGRHRILVRAAAAIWIFYFGLQTMLEARCLGFANGYGIGLICIWGMIMTVVLLFCNDIGTSFQRLEWRDAPDVGNRHSNGSTDLSTTSADNVLEKATVTRRRVYGVDGPAVPVSHTSSRKAAADPYTLVWQSYPSSIVHCMEWTADLMTTFRGVGWNWRIPTCPPLDVPIPDPKGKLKPRNVAKTSSAHPTTVSPSSLRQLQVTALRDFVVHYLVLDFLKTIMITDPYFMGTAELSSPSPWPFLDASIYPANTAWFSTRFTRLLLSIGGVLSALTFIFSLSPLCFISIPSAIMPLKYIRRITLSPLLEPALYPPFWQPLATVVEGGLAALWGKWWHQMFRFGISEPSRALIQHFNLDRKKAPARLLQLGTAFALSGLIHASASFTTFSASEPLNGPLVFFLLQGLGIMIQQQITAVVQTHVSFAYRMPYLQKTANVLFVLGWLFVTGPFLANDFARCGVWLFEPVPVSLLRGLIWGDWWAWKNIHAWVGWYQGATWYKSGLAIY